MEKLEDYLNRKIMIRMFNRMDFAALNMTKGDPTVYKNDTDFATAHGHTKQSLRYLLELPDPSKPERCAKIDEKGRVFTASRGTHSFTIKNYRGIE